MLCFYNLLGAVDLLSLNLNQTTISPSEYNKSLLAMPHNFLLTYRTESQWLGIVLKNKRIFN
ncbi:hypothetical protein HAPS_0769 [Glaesserella parasuis SH0165]|uniref:Uncharacterized protein n=1 Tax=Glaesserella parasuis serovar 5 (strain SH0165) TaxID=557723 RepID=B8F507_GLAP5|nr:hypothetical protein HAPS_0769 [Glaesserella parasuis SH0165]